MIGCGLLSGSLLILVSLGIVWLRVGEGGTERLVLDERVLETMEMNLPISLVERESRLGR